MPFSVSEFQERIRRTKERMHNQKMDVLLVTDPANMNYLSGYDGWSFYVHQLLILHIDEREPIWVGRGQDGNGARVTTWLSRENIITYTDDYVQSTIKHPMDFVADILKEKGWDKKTVGVEMDAYYFTGQCYKRLEIGLPQAKIVDATCLVNWVRIIKSETEIEYIRKASRIVEQAMHKAIDSIEVGVRECDVAANIWHALTTGTPEFGGDYPAIVPLIPAGEKTTTPHLSWGDERYKKGNQVNIEIAGCYKRYHSPLSRTVILGIPPVKLQSLADTVIEGINEALDAVKPGITCEDVEMVWRKSIAKSGFVKDSRIGYSMGLNYPPDWGEHTASLRPGDQTILQPNMTFHMIPGIWMEDFGFEISQTFRVTEKGCEIFASFPRKLFIK
ncbi:MAG: M24 family metallopeptidase [Bacillota bacterium]